MRFLQSQYHSFERERNAWEIERAEMKSRMGKLEGEARTSKRMQESLGKHVKLLEIALRKERDINKKLRSGQQVNEQKPDAGVVKDFAKAEYAAPASKGPNAVDQVELSSSAGSSADIKAKAGNGDGLQSDIRQDAERDKSRLYLNRCLQELTYHVMPTALAQQQAAEEQEQLMHEQQYGGQQLPQHSIEEAYMQRMRQHQANQPSAAPNHQPPPVPRSDERSLLSNQIRHTEQSSQSTEGLAGGPPPGSLTGPDGKVNRAAYQFEAEPEEQIESISHSYNAYGQPVTTQEDMNTTRLGQATEVTVREQDGWDFDEAGPAPVEQESPPEYTATQRPDQEAFPAANDMNFKDSPQRNQNGHRRKTSLSKRRTSDGSHELRELTLNNNQAGSRGDAQFRVRFALRGHVDVVRSVIFTGGGSPSEPEICTAGDDGVLKRWTIPASYGQFGAHSTVSSSGADLDVSSYFTHRGHAGPVMCLSSSPTSLNFLNGGRAQGDGWVFSGGQDGTVRVWERGRVDPKATLDGHTDAVWSICVLPATSGAILGDECSRYGGPDRILIVSGAADGTILVWAVSSPPQLTSPSTAGSRRGGRRANSVSSGSQFPSSPQATTSTATPFHYSLVHKIQRTGSHAPTCITPLSSNGSTFVVSYTDASVIVYDAKTGEEVIGMASQETSDGTQNTAVNAVVATSLHVASSPGNESREIDEIRGATASSGVEGIILSGHEDKYIRFFDANSGKSRVCSAVRIRLTQVGQCTYNMVAHESAISALGLSPDGRELVSAGHDASVRFWSLENRTCTQEITSHRPMRSEGVCSVVWSSDGRWIVSGGGDGVVKVFSR